MGNEFGQVLTSVLTTGEGSGLGSMASGIICRYELANVPPPGLLYTDRDCCGVRNIGSLFAAWGPICIHLDAWHFVRRLVTGCTTVSSLNCMGHSWLGCPGAFLNRVVKI